MIITGPIYTIADERDSTLIGFIVAATFAGIYGKRATDMLDTIKHMKDTIANEKAELQGDIRLDTDIHRMSVRSARIKYSQHVLILISQASLENLLTAIQATLTVIGKLEGAWRIIQSDLDGIHHLVQNDQKHPLIELIAKLDERIIIERWNEVNQYGTWCSLP